MDPDLRAVVEPIPHRANAVGETGRSGILGRDVADDPIQTQRGEGVGAGGLHGFGGEALAFGGGAEEVAEFGFSVAGFEAEEHETQDIAA